MHRADTGVPARQDGSGAHHRKTVFRIVGAQFVVTLLLAAVLVVWRGAETAQAALAGGVICVLANAGFAARAFRGGVRQDPRKMLSAMYVGEVLKIALTAGLFALAIIATELDVLVMLLAYLAATSVFWFALVADDGRQRFK